MNAYIVIIRSTTNQCLRNNKQTLLFLFLIILFLDRPRANDGQFSFLPGSGLITGFFDDPNQPLSVTFTGISNSTSIKVPAENFKSEGAISGYWKACAAVFLGILVLQFGYDAVRWYQYKKVANQTAAQAVDQFKYWFGQNYPVTEQNIKSQFEGQLRQSQIADTQALQLISRIGPVLMQNQIVAQRINYDASVLSMELKANSSDTLNALTKQLGQQGFKVELGNIQASGTGAIGLVRVQ